MHATAPLSVCCRASASRATDSSWPRPICCRPFRQHNPSLRALHEKPVKTELGQLAPPQVNARVRTEIARVLHQGEPRRGDVATRLHLIDRTLQRRLQAESVSYQQLLDDTRSELARQYLAGPRRSLTEVADLPGFCDQSNLFRACKRWFGMPPGQYRQHLLQPATDTAAGGKISSV